jgi:hypothetical protein
VESAQNGIGFWGLADLQVRGMSALGQKQTSDYRRLISALPPKADIDSSASDVRFVPIGDQQHRNKIKVIVASVRRTDKTDRPISVGGTPFKPPKL